MHWWWYGYRHVCGAIDRVIGLRANFDALPIQEISFGEDQAFSA